MPEPPAALYVRGELPRTPAVAIVGTRTPTPEGAEFARRLARDLALAGVAIFSGGAEGIDTAAHRGALDARGVTVVVAPAGYRAPYPAENEELFREVVASGGAYVSLVSEAQVAEQAAFFKRNACLVALAHALVVVQAPYRSGARNAAAWARRLGRPLLVVPSSPWIERGQGCLVELRRGALLCESARSVLEVLHRSGLAPITTTAPQKGASGRSATKRKTQRPPAEQPALFNEMSVSEALPEDPTAVEVLRAIGSGLSYPDELCVRLGLSAAAVHRALLTLRLGGFLVPGPFGGFNQLTRQKD